MSKGSGDEESGGEGSSTSGQDVVDVLSSDHREATALIAEIWATEDAAVRRGLAETLIAELVWHSVAEEMYVYPEMRTHLPNGDQEVDHDIEEHQELETRMKELENLEPLDTRFAEVLRGLEATLADHVADEEGTSFPQLRAALPREELVSLAAKVEGAKKLAPSPHPAAPQRRPLPQGRRTGRGVRRPPARQAHRPPDRLTPHPHAEGPA